jgi:hypothetical protein
MIWGGLALALRLLEAILADQLGALMEAEQQGITAPNSELPKGRASGRRWVELKMIRGYGPYAYERWFEGGRKRSRYIGKVQEHD